MGWFCIVFVVVCIERRKEDERRKSGRMDGRKMEEGRMD
jgi:hypothetical protein